MDLSPTLSHSLLTIRRSITLSPYQHYEREPRASVSGPQADSMVRAMLSVPGIRCLRAGRTPTVTATGGPQGWLLPAYPRLDRIPSRTTPGVARRRPHVVQDGIVTWISELRGRLASGALDGLGPLGLDEGTDHFPAAHIVRIMLNDLDDLDAFDQDHRGNGHPLSDDDLEERRVRRFELLAAFLRLREGIG